MSIETEPSKIGFEQYLEGLHELTQSEREGFWGDVMTPDDAAQYLGGLGYFDVDDPEAALSDTLNTRTSSHDVRAIIVIAKGAEKRSVKVLHDNIRALDGLDGYISAKGAIKVMATFPDMCTRAVRERIDTY
jgi:hypothetical protein